MVRDGVSMSTATRLLSTAPPTSVIVPVKLVKDPSWLPVTFEPVHSTFEFCGVMAKLVPATASDDATGAAAAALDWPFVGSLQPLATSRPS